MKLLSPHGVRVSVSDQKGEVLKRMGYREVGAVKSAPAPAPARKPRTRTPKATPES